MKNVAVKSVENDEALLCKRGLNIKRYWNYTVLLGTGTTLLQDEEERP